MQSSVGFCGSLSWVWCCSNRRGFKSSWLGISYFWVLKVWHQLLKLHMLSSKEMRYGILAEKTNQKKILKLLAMLLASMALAWLLWPISKVLAGFVFILIMAAASFQFSSEKQQVDQLITKSLGQQCPSSNKKVTVLIPLLF